MHSTRGSRSSSSRRRRRSETSSSALRGPIVAGKTSFSFQGNGNTRFNSNPIIAINESGARINDAARSTNDQSGFQIGVEHSLTRPIRA